MRKKYMRSHIGETFISNEGCDIKIIDGGSKNGYCTAIIYGGKKIYKKELTYGNVTNGSVKNYYLPSVFKIGYLGIGKYESTGKNNKSNKASVTWRDMLRRCYYGNNKNYNNVKVCEEWHNFQNFAEWYYDNYKEFKDEVTELDKDILSHKNNKIYSPQTCCFIPQRLNAFMTNHQYNNKNGYIGVNIDNSSGRYRARIQDLKSGKKISLGSYKRAEDATSAYKKARKKQCEIIKNMCEYKWNIKDKLILDNII